MQLLKKPKLSDIVINGYDGSEAIRATNREMLVDANTVMLFGLGPLQTTHTDSKGLSSRGNRTIQYTSDYDSDTVETSRERAKVDFDWITPETARDFKTSTKLSWQRNY